MFNKKKLHEIEERLNKIELELSRSYIYVPVVEVTSDTPRDVCGRVIKNVFGVNDVLLALISHLRISLGSRPHREKKLVLCDDNKGTEHAKKVVLKE